jgi:hypothetical protein
MVITDNYFQHASNFATVVGLDEASPLTYMVETNAYHPSLPRAPLNGPTNSGVIQPP